MQKRYGRPLRDAIALLRVPRTEVALKPEEAWRPLQRILDAMHAQIRWGDLLRWCIADDWLLQASHIMTPSCCTLLAAQMSSEHVWICSRCCAVTCCAALFAGSRPVAICGSPLPPFLCRESTLNLAHVSPSLAALSATAVPMPGQPRPTRSRGLW